MRGISVAVIVSALVSRRHPEVRRIHQRAEESRAGLIENRSRANTLGWDSTDANTNGLHCSCRADIPVRLSAEEPALSGACYEVTRGVERARQNAARGVSPG